MKTLITNAQILDMVKDVPNVTIQYFLLYSDELVLNYVGAIEDDII